MVPMAPSSTRMRSAASDLISLRVLPTGTDTFIHSKFSSGFLSRRSQPQQMADRVDKIGAVHGVKMKVRDAAIDQVEHLLGRDRSRDQLSGRDVVIEAVESLGEPARHTGAA